MGSGEQFCLRWNDFEANISRAFQDIREEKDFFDVTLACDDKTIQGHKVILSACSPFFRNVLKKHPHEHPLIYLKGVKYADLLSILNFMYYGEVNVAHEDLNAFLTVSEDLKVKGLTQNNTNNKPKENKEVQERPPQKHKIRDLPEREELSSPAKKQRPAPTTPVSHSQVSRSQDIIDEDEIEEITPASVKIEPGPTYSSSEIAVPEEHDVDNTSADGFGQEGYDYMPYDEGNQGFGNDSGMDHNAEAGSIVDGNKELEDAISKCMRKIMAADGRFLWQCCQCKKIHALKHVISDHVEAVHMEDISFDCPYCRKRKKSRSNLRAHISSYHREEHQLYRFKI